MTLIKKLIIGLICIVAVPYSLLAQNAIIQGKISDASNQETLISATVQIGTSGTVSDVDGNYRLEVPEGRSTVIFSYTGYETIRMELDLMAGVNQYDVTMVASNTLLQTATVTSGKFEKPLSEVTVSLDVLKANLIENVNTQQVDDVLNKVPGVNIIDGQANIRGGSGFSYGAGSRVMLLVDDIPALQADAGAPNWSDVATENIEQIEVVKGAASALYGSAAMNGIINIRTGFAKDEPITKLSTFGTRYLNPKRASAKWWDTPRYATGVNLSHKQKFGKLDLVASAYYFNEESYNQNTYSKYGRGTIGLRYRFNDRLSIGLNANVNNGTSGNFFYWKDGYDGIYQGNETSIVFSEKLRYYIDPYLSYFDKYNNKHKLMGRIYNVNNIVSDGKSNKSNLYYGEYQFQRNFVPWDLVLTSGVVYTGTDVQAELYGDFGFTSTNLAGYVQLDKKIGKRLNFSAGLRYEQNELLSPELIAGDTIPNGLSREAKPVARIGLNYQLTKATFLRGSWGQGYRFPTIAEKFINTNAGFPVLPNAKLFSETGYSSEIAVKQGFRWGGVEGFVDVAAFSQIYNDMMEFTLAQTAFGFQSQNIGNTNIKGIEISVMGQGKMGKLPVTFLTGYTYIDPKFQDFSPDVAKFNSTDQNVLKYRFKHVFKADFDIEPFKGLRVGMATFYNSHMINVDKLFELIIKDIVAFREAHNDGSLVFDVRASYEWKRLKATAICANLLNEEYINRPGLMEAPRNVTFRLDYSF